VPFELLVERLETTRDASRNPLFQVMFSYGEDVADGLSLAGLVTESVDIEDASSKFDLTLMITDDHESLKCSLEYNADLFDASTVRQMLRHWSEIVQVVVADQQFLVREISLLSPAEWQSTVREFCADVRQPAPLLFVPGFESCALKQPHATAVEHSARTISYAELNKDANRIARHLVNIGVGPEVPVAVCLGRRPELLVAILATLKAGAAFVPLDPEYPRAHLRWMVENARCPVVLTERQYVDHFTECSALTICLDDESVGRSECADDLARRALPGNSAYIMYTSGSSGRPKGVVVTHAGLANYVQHCVDEYFVHGGDGAPLHSSIGFDLTITTLLAPLTAGQCVHILRKGNSAEVLAEEFLKNPDFSFAKLTPAHLTLMSGALRSDGTAKWARSLIIGGEALSEEQLAFFRASAPDLRLINEYGPTEAVVGCCVYDATSSREMGSNVPIGKPIRGSEMYLLDDEMQPVPPGCVGEIYIGGATLARGYHRQPEKTAEVFLPNPYSQQPGARFYRTGDLGRRLHDGNIEFQGRKDLQVKSRGVRIEPGEVEAALCRHPMVKEALIVKGSGPFADSLLAYFVPVGPDPPDGDAMRDYLRSELPSYMIPSVFLSLNQFPLTPNGKVDRRALPVPTPKKRTIVTTEIPENDLEGKISGVWQAVLGVGPVNVNTNYFDAGGSSLRLLELHHRLESDLQVQVSVVDLFKYPSIRALSRHLAGKHSVVEAGPAAWPTPDRASMQRLEAQRAQRNKVRA
jgi:amino acid adenylation domain-containing protein